MTMTSRLHGRPAEAKPDSTICAQGVKMGGILLDPKLYSKVLRFIQIQIQNCFSKITTQINPHLMMLFNNPILD